jgi:hypothetical protein
MRPALPRLFMLVAVLIISLPACGHAISDLSPGNAAAGLKESKAFTTRPGSPVGRELVEIVAVRRIGKSSAEVEFTWRNAGGAGTGVATAPVMTSMALFRLRERDGSGTSSLMVRLHLREPAVWTLSSLYKVD